MKSIEINTIVIDGKIKNNRETLANAIEQFNGKEILIKISLKRKTRSNKQNRYYWAVVVPVWQNLIRTEWGEFYTKNNVHEFLKYNCNFEEIVNESTGEIIKKSKSTTENSTFDMEVFQEKARQLANEMFSVVIPLPNEQIKIEI